MSAYPPSPPPSAFVEHLRAITDAGGRPWIPFGELIALPELESRLHVPDELDARLARRPIVSVPVIDLASPRPHLTGSELLLTTGLGFTDDDEWYRGYVASIRDAGTAALGFGVEPVFDAVPAGLVRACRELGMPLVSFAPQIPFVHITTAFFAAIEDDRNRRLERLNRLALAMMRATRSHDPAAEMLHALAGALGAVAVLERGDERTAAGRLEHPDGGVIDVGTLLAAVDATAPHEWPLAAGGAPRSARLSRVPLPELGTEAITARLRPSRGRLPLHSRLVIAVPRRVQNTDLTAALLAADSLQLVHLSTASASASVDALLVGLLAAALGSPDRALRQRTAKHLRAALGASRSAPLLVCAARRVDGSGAPDSARGWWRSELGTPFVDIDDGALRAVVAAAPSTATIEAIRAEGWRIAVIGPLEPEAVPAGLVDAAALAGQEGRRERWAGLAAPEVRRAASRRWLAPLDELPADERERLVTVLGAWLAHHGAWDATARATGLHRNSVRRLVADAEALLDAPLADARVRAELLLALDALG